MTRPRATRGSATAASVAALRSHRAHAIEGACRRHSSRRVAVTDITEGCSQTVPGERDRGLALAAPSLNHAGIDHVPARRATASVLTVLGLRTAAAACGAVVTVLLTRLLGPSRFGELSLILAVAMIASSIAELGTTSVVTAEMAARPERRRELAAGVAGVRSTAGFAMALVGTLVLALSLERPAAWWAGVAVLTTVPLAGLTGLAILAQARLRPEVGAALSLGQSVLWLCGVALAAGISADLPVIGATFLVCTAVQAVATWLAVVAPEPPAWAQWRSAMRWTLARSWPLAVATVLGVVYYRVDGVLVFWLRGDAEAGVYGAAYRFLDVSQIVPIAMVSVLLPVLARRWARRDHDGFAAVLRLGTTVGAVFGALAAAGSLVCADRVAEAVFGSAFTGSGDALRILGLSVFSLATGYVYSAALIAAGEVKVVGLMSAVALVVSVVAGVPAISWWGATGAAWVTVGTEFLVSTTLGLRIHRRHRVPFPRRPVIASLGAAGVLVAVGWPLRGLPTALLLAVCLTVYASTAAWFGAITREDLRALLHPRSALGAAE